MQCDVKVVVILIHKYSSIINILFWYSKKTPKQPEPALSQGSEVKG